MANCIIHICMFMSEGLFKTDKSVREILSDAKKESDGKV